MNEYVIETEGLTKIFKGHKAVDNISIHVPKGKIYGLLGRNGAGKTTIIRMIMGLMHYEIGTVKIFGKDNKKNSKSIYSKIGSIIEAPGFYGNLTATDNLNIIAELMKLENRNTAIKQVLEIVNLQNETKKKVSNYSLGMKQRLGIARTLLNSPDLLVLDEPTNGLDPIGIREMRSLLKSLSKDQGKTILISSHILSEIEQMADCIGIIDEGKLLEEINMDNMHKINNKYIKWMVSNASKAAFIFERNFHIKQYEIEDDKNIRLYDFQKDCGDINAELVNEGVDVFKIMPCENTLEDYFTKLTGGIGIG